MKAFIATILGIICIFTGSLAYVYQKNSVIILAYEINSLQRERSALAEKEQKLLCDFYKNTSLAQINQWAEGKHFQLPAGNNVVQVALRDRSSQPPRFAKKETGVIIAVMEKFLGLDSRVEAQQDKK